MLCNLAKRDTFNKKCKTNQANSYPRENIALDSGSNDSRSSADIKSSIKLPFANALNSSPRPFKKLYADSEEPKFKNISEPAKSTPTSITNLRTPSSFVQNELFAKPKADEDDILGKLDQLNVNQQNIHSSPSSFKTDDHKLNAGNRTSQNATENPRQNPWMPTNTIGPRLRPSYHSDIAKDNDLVVASSQLACHHCKEVFVPGGVAVVAKCLEKELEWHPQCFVCYACKELLVDLVYFFHNGEVYCGRDYAKELNIPRCFACDELIFVREYTIAEGKNFHLRHFCCFECDTPLGGQKYVPKDDHPICLPCYSRKYGKKCATCHLMIDAQDSRISWKDYDWHEKADCFQCYRCKKSLLGSQFAVKNEKLICSKECAAKISLSH